MIKKGDLVMVVRANACCGYSLYVGKVFTVARVGRDSGNCQKCNADINETDYAVADIGGYFHFQILKKIDPPSEGETREAYVNLKQPIKETA